MWRRKEAALDSETVDGIIRLLMQIDSKIDDLLYHLGEDDAAEDDA